MIEACLITSDILGPQEGIIKILKQEGIEFLSVMPVGNLTPQASKEKLRIIMMRTERFAVGLADGYSRASNGKKIGVFNIQGGAFPVGAEIAQGAVAQAFEDSSPILGIMAGPTLSQLGQNRFDITRQYSGITKWTAYIPESYRIPEFMRRAFTYLRTGRRGPIVLHCSSVNRGPEELNWGDYDNTKYPYEPVKGWRYPGDPRDVEVTVKALLAAKKPVIYAGQGIFYADACQELVEFAELVQVPVVTTLLAKSAFPEDHPLSVGVSGIPAEHYIGGADLVFGIGESLSPGDFKHYFDGSGKIIIQADIDERDINIRYKIDHAIIGDAKLILQQLISEVKRQGRQGIRKNEKLQDDIRGLKAKKMEKYKQAIESNEKPINPYRVYWDLMNTIDRRNSVISHEAGSTRDQLRTIYEAIIPRGFIGWGNASSLGFGLSAAAGAKLAYPKRDCIHVTGDGGIMYQIGNFEALVRENIAITTIHINNSGFAGYGSGFWGSGHNPETSAVTSSTILSTSRIAEGFGEHAERVEEPDEIMPAIKRAIKVNRSGKPALLEFICSQYPVYDDWMHK
ncbi:MAG: thiamine pyrophosphate-dependent enzyme [Nitrososphaeria archaeon]